MHVCVCACVCACVRVCVCERGDCIKHCRHHKAFGEGSLVTPARFLMLHHNSKRSSALCGSVGRVSNHLLGGAVLLSQVLFNKPFMAGRAGADCQPSLSAQNANKDSRVRPRARQSQGSFSTPERERGRERERERERAIRCGATLPRSLLPNSPATHNSWHFIPSQPLHLKFG